MEFCFKHKFIVHKSPRVLFKDFVHMCVCVCIFHNTTWLDYRYLISSSSFVPFSRSRVSSQ